MPSNHEPSHDPGGLPPRDRPRRVTRSRRDRKIAGVAGGIANYFGIDPVLVRLAFVLAVFAAGTGVIAYAIAWIVLPAAEPDEDVAADRSRGGVRHAIGRVGTMDGTTVLAVILLVVATIVVLSGGDLGGAIVVAVALVGFGIYVLHQGGSPPTPPGEIVEVPAEDDSSLVIETTLPAIDVAPLAGEPGVAPPPPAPPPHRREPATVTRVALALVGLLFAAALGAGQLGWVDSDPSTVIAIGLVIIGAAAVVTAVVGHGRGLALAGIVLSLVFAVSLAVEPAIEHGVGERLFAPTTIESVAPSYELGIGRLELDLRRLVIPEGERVEVRVELGIGEALVRVPDGVDLEVDGEVGVGRLVVLDESQEGIRNELTAARDTAAQTTLVIELTQGMGNGVVQGG